MRKLTQTVIGIHIALFSNLYARSDMKHYPISSIALVKRYDQTVTHLNDDGNKRIQERSDSHMLGLEQRRELSKILNKELLD